MSLLLKRIVGCVLLAFGSLGILITTMMIFVLFIDVQGGMGEAVFMACLMFVIFGVPSLACFAIAWWLCFPRLNVMENSLVSSPNLPRSDGDPWPIRHRVPSDPPQSLMTGTPPASPTALESHVWSGRPSQLSNLSTFILCLLFCWLVIPIFVAIYRFLLVNSVRYDLSTQRLRVTAGIIARSMNEMELYRVKDTTFSQTTWQRFFGFASVYITSSDRSNPSTQIAWIPSTFALRLREQLRMYVEDLRDRKRVRETDFV